jgi:hypothetical protein
MLNSILFLVLDCHLPTQAQHTANNDARGVGDLDLYKIA